ncbi:MAG: F0F1 ATP synthase subunit delta [Legionella sp.]|nr:MAG: F0F1 ATP synthase subunit delta [Legionella sp.]
MSNSTTIARPYAKAIFEYALENNKLREWSEYLSCLAQTVLDPNGADFIHNPAATVDQHIELLITACGPKAKDDEGLKNFVRLLATNKRLMLLLEIKSLYEVHRAEQEKTLVVDVLSFAEVSNDQQQKLIDSLSKRLQRKVSLKIRIDSSLLGGAKIQAGDLVIDGSVRGMLNKLSTDLAA